MYGVLNFKKENNFEIDESNSMSYKFQGNTYTVVYSGHIYNYKKLKELLINKDFEIETSKDEEILIKLYIAFGKEFVEYLNGAYSFVIWNEKEKELLVVRDRFGLEPFYYAMKNGSFIFSSSIKEILDRASIKPEIDSNRNRRIAWSRTSAFSRKDAF